MKELYGKYKTVLLYLFFGGCTTLVNMACYHVLYNVWKVANVPSTAAAWLVSVLFAFVTNKIFVFESRRPTRSGRLKELAGFVGCRAATGALDVGIMAFCVDYRHGNGLLWKFLSNIVVVVLNYIASKWFIFKKS